MKLRALEIQGFKSFADKTRLSFEKPVTCVVGPNGSGKSNISDAILWVTGEQSSKALRGGKMEDVIFGGTARRHQMGYAEVSLVLDNTDGSLPVDSDEVMITRRYYRSGESEYYINKRVCRLKDVNELLMDTGMGREGYSIIGQGKIDEILSVKSTDRRAIFEEAAGISRYRHRKEESERKLQRTEENLLRVNDKISELELQVEPLKKQAETAKKYLSLRDELKEVEVSVWTDTLEKLSGDIEKAIKDRDAVGLQLESAKKELEEFYAESEAFSQETQEKDVKAEELRRLIAENDEKIGTVTSAIAVLSANLESNSAEAGRIKSEIDEQESRSSGIEEQIEAYDRRSEEIKAELSALEEGLNDLGGELSELDGDMGHAAERLAELRRLENEKTGLLAEKKAELLALATAAQEIEDRETKSAGDMADTARSVRKLEADRESCAREYDEAEEERSACENAVSGYSMKLAGRRKRLEELTEKLKKAEMDLGAVNSRISLLSEMEKEYQGYSKAVKTVMQEAGRGGLSGIHGTLGELARAKDGYALAVETALGAAVQNIVVDREEDGKAAINMLKRRDGGRATFLPLSTIKGSRLGERGLDGEAGFVGLAIDLITFDGKYRAVYENALGRVAVAEDMDAAIRIGRKYSNRFRIVTEDGQVINAGGSMTGGSYSKNAGILSRANEIERLRAKKTGLDREFSEVSAQYKARQSELLDAEHELETARDRLYAGKTKAERLKTELSHYDVMLKAARESLEAIKSEAEGLKERIEISALKMEDLKGVIRDVEGEAESVRLGIESLTAGREDMDGRRGQINERVNSLRQKRASLISESSAIDVSAAQLHELRAGLRGGRDKQLEYVAQLERRSGEILNEIDAENARLVTMRAETERLRAQVEEINREKLDIEARRVRHGKELQEKNNSIINLEREYARLDQRRAGAEADEKQLIDKLWDTYELTRSAAFERRHTVEDMTAARQQIAELRRQISRLGTPNLGAIDEYERVNERYTYLTDQRDDIKKAEKELLEIISDITNEMREIFSREFEIISREFERTFLELFGGGKAKLELEDPEDILNCGIEIKVQPPGKSLKTITLLSGGEKAFVAIALYFAVLKVRPAPFVIMDEIESALDEANVQKFAKYMRKMTGKTQMIVISHRRGTMEEADVLYGVTMQEQGVSKVIDIDLETAERTITA